MVMRSINNTFNSGELDPSLNARDDLAVFSKGARKLRNMIPLWTGAARIAPGTVFIDSIVDRENSNAVITNPDHARGVDFLFSSDDDIIYTIIIRKSGAATAIDIYFNDTLQATVTGAPYTPAQVKSLRFAAAKDRLLILNSSNLIRQLKRGASHSSWTLSTLTPSIFPTFDYSTIGEATSYTSFTFTLGATTGTGINLTSSSAVFTANHIGGLFRDLSSGGIARITAVGSTTSATVDILDDFASTSISGDVASLAEKLWSAGGGSPAGVQRGWPEKGAFFLNRLIFAGNLFLNNIVVVSTAGVFDNFDDSDVDALASFNITLNANGEQAIQSVVADDSILFLTSNKVFAQSPLVETPLTASNVYFAPQTQAPAADFEAATIDNQILYISANKSQVLQIIYKTDSAKYISVPATQLSSHLIETLSSNATWEPKGVTTKLYMATQEDGTMVMYSTLFEQNVAGWSLRDTRGKFIQVIGEGRQAHVIAQRQINLGNSTFETTLDEAFLSDSTFKAFNSVQAIFASGASAIAVLEDQNDYILMGNDIPFTAIDITLNTVASHDVGLEFEYLDGNGFWNTFTPTDNTSGLTASGSITWDFTDVLNWQPNTVNAIENTYWIRLKRTTETVTTSPIVTTIDVNTGERLYLERKDFDKFTDSTIEKTSNSAGLVTGLNHLAGHQIYAIQNGATNGPFFVDSSGETTIKATNATVDIGIQYKPLLVPMPLYVPTQEGDNMYAQKYVQDLFIDYVDSLYLQAGMGKNITDIPNMPLGNYTMGQAVAPQTNVFKITPHGDWQPRQEIRITQSQPGPMTIIGVGYHVEVT